MKIRFRFRYNGLLLICIVFAVIISTQQQQISSLQIKIKTIQDSIPSVRDWREHSRFMNRRCDLIEHRIEDVYSEASSAYNIAYSCINNGKSQDDWMIGKTTEEISRILIEKRDAKYEIYKTQLDTVGGEK